MQFHIRGGTHEESAFIPGMTVPPLGLATLRGTDMVAWYTTAWFDKYVKCADGSDCERDADRRLLTDRWRDDARGGQVDVNGDPNLYSFYRRSRYDLLTAAGARGHLRRHARRLRVDGARRAAAGLQLRLRRLHAAGRHGAAGPADRRAPCRSSAPTSTTRGHAAAVRRRRRDPRARR